MDKAPFCYKWWLDGYIWAGVGIEHPMVPIIIIKDVNTGNGQLGDMFRH